jgi:hypothetical protein
MIPAIALGQEPPEPEVMGELPRDPHAGLLTESYCGRVISSSA